MEKLAIVIVTYKRQQLLETLFDSLLCLQTPPWRIILVDNENSAETALIAEAYQHLAREFWGEPEADALGGTDRIVYFPQEVNSGGAGGFSAGTGKAYELGAEWFWLMDDDVAVEPDAIAKLSKWAKRFDVIQGRRYNFNGEPFYWQYNFINFLGIPNPIAPGAFPESGYKNMNTACFEGGLFKRSVVQRIGLPDPRFFIYWDDAMYGYLASKVTQGVAVSDFVMRRTRTIKNWDIAGVRKLNSTSDMNRYHIMRNRGYMMRYFQEQGDYSRFGFGLGTALTFGKEMTRIVMVDKGHFASSTKALLRGWRDSRPIMRDPSWKPMPPLD